MQLSRQNLETLLLVRDGVKALGITSFFVGGGCLRDWLLARTPKDVDVFTFQEFPTELDLPPSPDWKGEPYDDPSRIKAVSRPLVFPEIRMPVQIITLEPEPCHGSELLAVGQFMLGLQQVSWSEKSGLFSTNDFDHDVLYRRMTVRWCTSKQEAQRIVNKVKSLRDRYPSHTFVVPSRFYEFFPRADSQGRFDDDLTGGYGYVI